MSRPPTVDVTKHATKVKLRKIRTYSRFLAKNHHEQNHLSLGWSKDWHKCEATSCVMAKEIEAMLTAFIDTPLKKGSSR